MAGFTKIGKADLSDCIFSLLPSAERNFRTSDANTGYANLYKGDVATTAKVGVLTNMATSYGYVYNGGNPYYNFGAVDEIINFGSVPEINGLGNFTISFWMKQNSNNTNQYIQRIEIDSLNRFTIRNTTVVGAEFQLDFRFGVGGWYTVSHTSVALVDTWNHYLITFDGSQALALNKTKLYINGVAITLTPVGTIGTAVPNFTGYDYTLGYTTNSLDGKLRGYDFFTHTKTPDQALIEYQLGIGKFGLIGTDLTSGEMSLSDNQIGLFNPYNNIMSALLSTDPATVDRNTGYINCFNGESASGTITGTLINFASDEGFIAKSGSVPAHILFNGINSYVNYGDVAELNSVTEFSINIDFNLDNSQGADKDHWLLIKNGGFDRIGITIQRNASPSSEILQIQIGDGVDLNILNIDIAGVVLANTWYNLQVCYNGNEVATDRVKVYLDSVLLTSGTITGTIPAVTTDMTGVDLWGGTNGVATLDGMIRNFIITSDCKSESFIKDQYFSSQNEWQNDLTGTLQTVPDGTLNLSAEYTYFDAQQVRLNKDGGVITSYDWGTGRVGPYIRPVGATNEGNEILARFDLSNIVNSTLTRLLAYSDSIGTQIASDTSRVFEQDKTSLVDVTSASAFDDFTDTTWTSQVGSVSMQGVQSYEYTLTDMDSLVSEWVSNTKDQDNGIIIDVNYASAGEYNDIFSVKLGVKIGGTIIVPFHILNYLNQSF